MHDPIALVSAVDIAKATGAHVLLVRAWLAATQRTPIGLYKGEPLYLAAVTHALLDEGAAALFRRTSQ